MRSDRTVAHGQKKAAGGMSMTRFTGCDAAGSSSAELMCASYDEATRGSYSSDTDGHAKSHIAHCMAARAKRMNAKLVAHICTGRGKMTYRSDSMRRRWSAQRSHSSNDRRQARLQNHIAGSRSTNAVTALICDATVQHFTRSPAISTGVFSKHCYPVRQIAAG